MCIFPTFPDKALTKTYCGTKPRFGLHVYSQALVNTRVNTRTWEKAWSLKRGFFSQYVSVKGFIRECGKYTLPDLDAAWKSSSLQLVTDAVCGNCHVQLGYLVGVSWHVQPAG